MSIKTYHFHVPVEGVSHNLFPNLIHGRIKTVLYICKNIHLNAVLYYLDIVIEGVVFPKRIEMLFKRPSPLFDHCLGFVVVSSNYLSFGFPVLFSSLFHQFFPYDCGPNTMACVYIAKKPILFNTTGI